MADSDDDLFGPEHVRVYRETGGERGYDWRRARAPVEAHDRGLAALRRIPDAHRPRDPRGRALSPLTAAHQLVEGAAAEHRRARFGDHVRPRSRVLVAALDQEPLGLGPRARTLQRESPVQLLAVQHE